MRDYHVSDIVSSQKHLFVISVNLEKKGEMNNVTEIVRPIFTEIAPFLKKKNQVLYVRDIKKFCIDDGLYIGGNTYIGNEAKIAVPQWPSDEINLREAIAHELHHVARWQTVGYGKTLGEALVSEGFAQAFAFEKTHWLAPWSQVDVSGELIKKALEEWDSSKYKHQEWFFDGPLGRWIGYGLSYRMVSGYCKNGFDLPSSLTATEKDLKKFLT
jgi:hypothetical protein